MKSSRADPGDEFVPLLSFDKGNVRIWGWVNVGEASAWFRGYINMRRAVISVHEEGRFIAFNDGRDLPDEPYQVAETPRDVLEYIDGAWAWLEVRYGWTGAKLCDAIRRGEV